MTRLVYAPAALADLERLCEFLLGSDPGAAVKTGAIIVRGIEVLAEHPLVGRPVEAGLRELIISRGNTGYVALYRYDVALDRAMILAIRHQREAGFA